MARYIISAIALYSVSAVDIATAVCFLDSHAIGCDRYVMNPPVTERLSIVSFAQSTSALACNRLVLHVACTVFVVVLFRKCTP